MYRTGLLFTLCLALLCSFSFGYKDSPELHFIKSLNDYDKTKLEELTSPDFEIKRTFSPFVTSREEFVGGYLDRCKVMNAKFIIEKTLQADTPQKYLVRDKSDYFELMKVSPPKWILTLTTNEMHQVSSMLIDTTENYTHYKQDLLVKEQAFRDWMKKNYPSESTSFMEAPEHFMKRLREYSKDK